MAVDYDHVTDTWTCECGAEVPRAGWFTHNSYLGQRFCTQECPALQALEPPVDKAKVPFVRADRRRGAWIVPKDNGVFDPPYEEGECRFTGLGYYGAGPRPPVRGVATDSFGRVFGVRALSNAQSSGYQLEGRVSVAGRKLRAFTSSQLFEEPGTGRLCDVGILHICWPVDRKAGEEST